MWIIKDDENEFGKDPPITEIYRSKKFAEKKWKKNGIRLDRVAELSHQFSFL